MTTHPFTLTTSHRAEVGDRSPSVHLVLGHILLRPTKVGAPSVACRLGGGWHLSKRVLCGIKSSKSQGYQNKRVQLWHTTKTFDFPPNKYLATQLKKCEPNMTVHPQVTWQSNPLIIVLCVSFYPVSFRLQIFSPPFHYYVLSAIMLFNPKNT